MIVAPGSSGANIPNFGGASDAHKVIVSLGVLLVIGLVLVEVAGTGKSAAVPVALVFGGLLMLQAVTHTGWLAGFSSVYPWVPPVQN